MKLKDTGLFVTFLLAMSGLVLLIAGLAYHKDPTWWAAWGQWVGGLGSIAAAWAAVWIAIKGWRKVDQAAAEQTRRADEAQSRELASKFGAWIDREDLANLKIRVVNSGPLPIYNIILLISMPRPDVDAAHMLDSDKLVKFQIPIDTLGPTGESHVHENATKSLREFIDDLIAEHIGEPARKVNHISNETTFGKGGRQAMRNITPWTNVEVRFSDTNSLRWVRKQDGKLSPGK